MARDFSKSTGAKALNAVAKKSNETANASFIIWVNDSDLVDYSENEDMGFSLDTTEDLEIAIEQNGFTDPLEVIPFPGGKYEIRSGHRRRLAGRNKGMTSFPVIVKEDLGEVKNRRAVLEANFRREMTPMQYAKLIAAWEEQLKREKMKGDKRKYISKVLNLSEAQISRYNSLNKMITPLQELVDSGKIGLSSVSSIAKYTFREQEEILSIFNQFFDSHDDVPEEERYEWLTRDKAKELLSAYENGVRDYDEIQIAGQMDINDEEYTEWHPTSASNISYLNREVEVKAVPTYEVNGEAYGSVWNEIISSLISEMIKYQFYIDLIDGDRCTAFGKDYFAYNVNNDGYITIEDDKEEEVFRVSIERFEAEYEFHKARHESLSNLKPVASTDLKATNKPSDHPVDNINVASDRNTYNIFGNKKEDSLYSEADMPNVEQPRLPTLKNNDQRKDFIDSYESWPVWIDLKETGERYYRYEFTDTIAIVVKVSLRHVRINYKETSNIGFGAEEYYLIGIKPDYSLKGSSFIEDTTRTFYECHSNKTILIDYIKEYQKINL